MFCVHACYACWGHKYSWMMHFVNANQIFSFFWLNFWFDFFRSCTIRFNNCSWGVNMNFWRCRYEKFHRQQEFLKFFTPFDRKYTWNILLIHYRRLIEIKHKHFCVSPIDLRWKFISFRWSLNVNCSFCCCHSITHRAVYREHYVIS